MIKSQEFMSSLKYLYSKKRIELWNQPKLWKGKKKIVELKPCLIVMAKLYFLVSFSSMGNDHSRWSIWCVCWNWLWPISIHRCLCSSCGKSQMKILPSDCHFCNCFHFPFIPLDLETFCSWLSSKKSCIVIWYTIFNSNLQYRFW